METLTVNKLREFCRVKHIKKYSHLTKKELIKLLKTNQSTLKIQRWIRKIFSKDENCPISFDPIKYPCFAYVPRKGVIIYYNLAALKSFLITTGDFRDPSTREFYTDEQLKQIDTIDDYYQKHKTQSVYKASKNTKYYKKIKERESEIELLERVLDDIIEELFEEIINDKTITERHFVLDSVFFVGYRLQWRRLLLRSKDHAEYAIKKNIEGICFLYDKVEDSYDQSQKEDHEYVIHWLYQLREELEY